MRGLWQLLFSSLVPYNIYILNHVAKPFESTDWNRLNFDFVNINDINTHLNPTAEELSKSNGGDTAAIQALVRQQKLRDIEINLINLNLPLSSITEAMALFPSNFDKKIYDDLISYNTNRNKFMENYRRQRAAQKS